MFAFNLRFPGQYYDAETGKHYNYFRDYDPSIGRYIQSDPIGLIGGLDTFSYVSGSPIVMTDSSGLLSDQQCCDKSNELKQGSGHYGWVICCEGRMVSCSFPRETNERAQKIVRKCTKVHEDVHHDQVPPCLSCEPEPRRLRYYRPNVDGDASECLAYAADLKCMKVEDCGNDNECRKRIRHLAKFYGGVAREHCRKGMASD